MTAGRTGIGKVRFNGTEIYVAYAPVSSMNWSLAISLPVSEINGPVEKFTGKIADATQDTGIHITAQTDWLKEVFQSCLWQFSCSCSWCRSFSAA